MSASSSPSSPSKIVTAVFESLEAAEPAYRAALELGYEPNDINMLMSESTRDRYLSKHAHHTALAEKAAESTPQASKRAEFLGGPAGGTVGTIAPAIAALGAALLIPGLGLAAAGPIAVGLTAAGSAGLAAGLLGAFTNWGIPPERAEQYENALRKGAVVLGIEPRSEEDRDALLRRWS